MTVEVVAAAVAVATMKADATMAASISDAPKMMDADIIGKMVAAYTATRVTAVNRLLRSGDQRRPQIGG